MGLVLSFHICVGSGDPVQVIHLVEQSALSVEPFCWPLNNL